MKWPDAMELSLRKFKKCEDTLYELQELLEEIDIDDELISLIRISIRHKSAEIQALKSILIKFEKTVKRGKTNE